MFANKQDQPGAMTAAEVSQALSLTDLKTEVGVLLHRGAIKGEGLTEGLDWLMDVIKDEQL